jgi:hypothetical protein
MLAYPAAVRPTVFHRFPICCWKTFKKKSFELSGMMRKQTKAAKTDRNILREIGKLRALVTEIDQKLEHLIRSFHLHHFTTHSSNSPHDEFMN